MRGDRALGRIDVAADVARRRIDINITRQLATFVANYRRPGIKVMSVSCAVVYSGRRMVRPTPNRVSTDPVTQKPQAR